MSLSHLVHFSNSHKFSIWWRDSNTNKKETKKRKTNKKKVKKKEQTFLLNNNLKILLWAFNISTIGDILVMVFLNAFVWFKFNNLIVNASYYLGYFVGLMITYYVNGILLRYFNIKRLYAFGLVFSGFAIFPIFLINKELSYLIVLLGLVVGSFNGIFWSCRNLMISVYATSKTLLSYISLSGIFGNIILGTFPILIGFLANIFLENLGLSRNSVYFSIFTFAIVTYIISAIVITKLDKKEIIINQIIKKKASKEYNLQRYNLFLYGTVNGLTFFLADVLILYYSPNEAVLGTFVSLSTIVFAATIFIFNLKFKKSFLTSAIIFGILFTFIGAFPFLYLQNTGTVLIYKIFLNLANGFLFIGIEYLMFKFIGRNILHSYEKLFDQELFLNFGRVIGIGSLILMINKLDLIFGIIIISILLILITLKIAFITKKIEYDLGHKLFKKKQKKNQAKLDFHRNFAQI